MYLLELLEMVNWRSWTSGQIAWWDNRMKPQQIASGLSSALTAVRLADLGIVNWNLDVPDLYERVIGRGEARLSRDGVIVTATGPRTGRSPQDRFIVEEPSSAADIWWGDANRPQPWRAGHRRH